MRLFSRKVAIFLSLASVVLLAAILAFAVGIPNVSAIALQHPRTTSYTRLRSQEEARSPEYEIAEWTALRSASPLLLCAIVKAEDRSFFRHRGFDRDQLKKAFGQALHGNASMGGSTITQQLARNLYLTPDRSILRKAREVLITWRLESKLTKLQILETYVNVIELGSGIWGMGPATSYYFSKSPSELDAFQATFLAGLIAAPRAALTGKNLDRALRVQARVLHQLFFSGIIDVEEWTSATRRAMTLRKLLLQRVEVRQALREATPTDLQVRKPSRFDRSAIPLDQALDQHCGIDRELEETQKFRESFGQARAG